MEMHEIKYFLAACRTLNFHRAAELSHVSQPALTRAVQKLEAELGAHLFHRERSQIRVTDFGRLMRSHLEQVLRETDTAKVAARSFLKLEAAPLALGVMCTIGPLRFVGFLNDFREQHPGIEVSVIENVPGRPGRHARHCPDGSTKPVRCEAQCGANLPGAFRLGLPGWSSL